jgi:TetR/AcrR family transcriptional regulator, lmrAB and yxaGH operons repressor
MTEGTRERMIDGMVRLLATRGLQGASIGEMLDATGTPRGSLYHHFPGGKDELVRAALDRVARNSLAAMEEHRGEAPPQVVAAFLGRWRDFVVGTHFRAGCSALAVTVAAGEGAVLDRASAVFREWRDQLIDLLVAGGTAPARARLFSILLLAGMEGAVVLARAERDIGPFDAVAEQLTAQAADLATVPSEA